MDTKDTPIGMYMSSMIDLLKKYNQEMKDDGFVPTIDMLIEDLENTHTINENF